MIRAVVDPHVIDFTITAAAYVVVLADFETDGCGILAAERYLAGDASAAGEIDAQALVKLENRVFEIDLLGRKVLMKGGAGWELLLGRINDTITQCESEDALREFARSLSAACDQVSGVTNTLRGAAAEGKTAAFLANSSVYLDMFSHVVLAWLWLQQAAAAQRGLPGAHGPDRQFYTGKIQACRYYYRYELPKVRAQSELLSSLDTTCLDMAEESF